MWKTGPGKTGEGRFAFAHTTVIVVKAPSHGSGEEESKEACQTLIVVSLTCAPCRTHRPVIHGKGCRQGSNAENFKLL
jgi:hypothetical protein